MPPTEVEIAEVIAKIAHFYDTRWDGSPYINHVATVVDGVPHFAKPAAWLHDVMEDHPAYTSERLREVGISEETLEAVRLLTHLQVHSYEEYIERIATSKNEIAILVKLADLRHNSSSKIELTKAKIEKYAKAIARLEGVLEKMYELT